MSVGESSMLTGRSVQGKGSLISRRSCSVIPSVDAEVREERFVASSCALLNAASVGDGWAGLSTLRASGSYKTVRVEDGRCPSVFEDSTTFSRFWRSISFLWEPRLLRLKKALYGKGSLWYGGLLLSTLEDA